MPESTIAILMPAPAFAAPPGAEFQAGAKLDREFPGGAAFINCVATLRYFRPVRIRMTPITPDMALISATRSGGATTKIAFSTPETEPTTRTLREASALFTVACVRSS